MNPEALRWPPWVVTGAAFLLSVLVAILDHLTGGEFSFSIFYLGPVGLAAWAGPRKMGGILALWSGILWLAVDLQSGNAYSYQVVPYWNALVRVGFFLIVSLLLTRIRRTLDLEHLQAHIDSLTGLPNSRGFLAMVDGEVVRVRRYGRPLTLAYLDLDNFKAVNDTRGHAEGDRLLRVVAEALRKSLRETDGLARLGGDEFCALLPETGGEGAAEVLRKVRAGVLALAESEGWPVTISLGAVTFLTAPPSTAEAIRRADDLMYQVKQSGKDAILQEVVSDPVGLDSPGPS